MDHRYALRKRSKTALQNAADNSKYVELVRSGEDYFLRLDKYVGRKADHTNDTHDKKWNIFLI